MPSILATVVLFFCVQAPVTSHREQPGYEVLAVANNAALMPIVKQRTIRDCVVAAVDMLAEYACRTASTDSQVFACPSYEQIEEGLRRSEVGKTTNIRKYISGRSVSEWFNSALHEERKVPFRVKSSEHNTSMDCVVEAINRSHGPVLVSIMMEAVPPLLANLADLPLALTGNQFRKSVLDGEEYVYSRYLHVVVVVMVVRQDGKRYLVAADPWCGISFVSSGSPGFIVLEEKDFIKAWTTYAPQGAVLPYVQRSYANTLQKDFEFLAEPGSMLTLEDNPPLGVREVKR